ncbi:MAG: hypothetical protein HYZ28_20430 [Myxococcales bacterium]|nr:hypothetical protein [Myxococcales bacterium]
MTARILSRCALVALVLAGCSDSKKRAEQRQRAIEEQRAQLKGAKEEKGAGKPEPVKLEAFWDDPGYLRLSSDGACPEGVWALFPGNVPGEDATEKKANEGRRGELASKLKASTALVKLHSPMEVKLHDFDAPKGSFPIEIAGSVDCTDSFGHLTLAWAPAKAVIPANSAAKQGAEVQQNLWQVEPLSYHLPMSTQAEAKEFRDKHRFDLTARLVLRLGKSRVDKKMFRTSKVTQGDISLGGGLEDWGAGRLIQAEVLGLRLATDFEKKPLIENREGK